MTSRNSADKNREEGKRERRLHGPMSADEYAEITSALPDAFAGIMSAVVRPVEGRPLPPIRDE